LNPLGFSGYHIKCLLSAIKNSVPLKTYKHIFFDLDNTLWDYRSNARETFDEVIRELKLTRLIDVFEAFVETFEKNNDLYWRSYRKGLISKELLRHKRFSDTLEVFGIYDADLAGNLAEKYLQRVSRKSILFPGVHETLHYLKEKYLLYIITNGFAEIQTNKIESSDLGGYFTRVFMAETSGYQKPDKRFFQYALSSSNARKTESLMVGDDWEADIEGASQAGIDQVFFRPTKKKFGFAPTYEIAAITELMDFL
jgi:putative hydrolase of the HAD superfamily